MSRYCSLACAPASPPAPGLSYFTTHEVVLRCLIGVDISSLEPSQLYQRLQTSATLPYGTSLSMSMTSGSTRLTATFTVDSAADANTLHSRLGVAFANSAAATSSLGVSVITTPSVETMERLRQAPNAPPGGYLSPSPPRYVGSYGGVGGSGSGNFDTGGSGGGGGGGSTIGVIGGVAGGALVVVVSIVGAVCYFGKRGAKQATLARV